jgi:hypothetical protein
MSVVKLCPSCLHVHDWSFRCNPKYVLEAEAMLKAGTARIIPAPLTGFDGVDVTFDPNDYEHIQSSQERNMYGPMPVNLRSTPSQESEEDDDL